MSKALNIVLIILALAIGFGAGLYIKDTIIPPVTQTAATCPTTAKTTETTAAETTAATSNEAESCIKAKLGEAKYNSIKANPSLATVDDKFAVLPCYK